MRSLVLLPVILLLACSRPPANPPAASPTVALSPSPAASASATPDDRRTVSDVPCKSIAQCWLDEDGKPIARPKKLAGKPLPRGDCGKHLEWLRNRLECDQNRCTATFVGDKC
jgi:hypothetical protein